MKLSSVMQRQTAKIFYLELSHKRTDQFYRKQNEI